MWLGRKVVFRFRRLLYWPVEQLRWMWLMRLVVKVDAPLRRFLLEGAFYAKSTG